MPGPYEIAKGWTGTREGDAALNDFLYNGGRNLDSATRAWCSDFVKAAAAKSGISTNATGMARSWLDEGQPVDQPQIGDVAVFSRGDDPNSGHVGFYEGTNPDGTIKVLSGNHANAAASGNYPVSRLLGYRRLGPGNDPRNVAMNGGQSGVDPDGFARVSGNIHTQAPGDTGVPFAPKPVTQTPNSPTPKGAFGSSLWAGLKSGIGAFADSMGGDSKQDDAGASMLTQLTQSNTSALSEEEQRAAQALKMVTARNPRLRAGAFA